MNRRRAIILAALAASTCGDGETPTAPPPPEPTRPAAVAVTPATVGLTALGATAQLTAEVRDQNGGVMAGVGVTWASSASSVATADGMGVVTAVADGVATITAMAGQASGSAAVSVMQSAASVRVLAAVSTILPGDTLRLVAEAQDENGHPVAGAVFTWSSSEVSVARVDGMGLVRGVREGSATITAMVGTAQGTAEITVVSPDRAALVALYEATGGPNWRRSGSWLTAAPLGEWHGVNTNPEGRVTGLYLNDNDLIGPIPPELGNLASLTGLDLNDNALAGPIPPELGNLTGLEGLYLIDNDLTGPIPPELGNLTGLWLLYLDDNALGGQIPPELGNLASLEELRLYNNYLSGQIPPELGNLASLKLLDIGDNALGGPIPPELANLTGLEWLALGGNELCAPNDPRLRAWLLERRSYPPPCPPHPNVRLLPRALMREDGNGVSLTLPEDLRNPAAVTVSDARVVAATVFRRPIGQSGLLYPEALHLVPRGRGNAEVEVVPSGGGAPAIVEVVGAGGRGDVRYRHRHGSTRPAGL